MPFRVELLDPVEAFADQDVARVRGSRRRDCEAGAVGLEGAGAGLRARAVAADVGRSADLGFASRSLGAHHRFLAGAGEVGRVAFEQVDVVAREDAGEGDHVGAGAGRVAGAAADFHGTAGGAADVGHGGDRRLDFGGGRVEFDRFGFAEPFLVDLQREGPARGFHDQLLDLVGGAVVGPEEDDVEAEAPQVLAVGREGVDPVEERGVDVAARPVDHDLAV